MLLPEATQSGDQELTIDHSLTQNSPLPDTSAHSLSAMFNLLAMLKKPQYADVFTTYTKLRVYMQSALDVFCLKAKGQQSILRIHVKHLQQ